MCRPVNASTSSDMLRCRPTVTNRGQFGRANRTDVSSPSTTLAVIRRSAMMPVARVVYQSGLVEVTTTALGCGAAATAVSAITAAPAAAWRPDNHANRGHAQEGEDPARGLQLG